MDIGAIIVTVLLAGSFFGFVVWAAIHSRKSNLQKPSNSVNEVDFSNVNMTNEQFDAD